MPIFKFVHTKVIEEYTNIYVEAASAEEAQAYTEVVNDEVMSISPSHDEMVDERIEFQGEVDPKQEQQAPFSTFWEPEIVIDDEFKGENATDAEIEQQGYVPLTRRGYVSPHTTERQLIRAAIRCLKNII